MKVIITKKHCDNSIGYDSTKDCPLCVALKEQYPELGLFHAGGSYIRRKKDDQIFKFNSSSLDGWCFSRVEELESGKINSYTVDINYPDYDNKPKVKEIIRYVSVPETISEMETVLN